MPVNYKNLKKLYEGRDPREADSLLLEAFQTREFQPDNIDLGRLFVECFGFHEFEACRSGGQGYPAHGVMQRALTEAEGAVATDAFLHISGQIVYSTTLEGYNMEEGVFSNLIPEVKTQFLDGEKIAGITEMGDEIQVRNEAQPYAIAGVGEDWIRTPVTKDRGVIVPVTWEAVFADRTGQLLEKANKTGRWYKQNREKRAIDAVIDENSGNAHRYNWRDTVIASYGDNSGTHSWDNLAASNALLDWSSINTAEQVFNAITDPYTGEPTVWEPKHLVVTKQNEQTARRILRAGEIRVTTPGYATSGNPTQTNVSNPYSAKFELVTSRLLAARLATDTDWFLGDISQYARYMVVRPFEVVSAPSGMPEEFHRRIIAQSRVSEHAAYVVYQPRAMVKSTVA